MWVCLPGTQPSTWWFWGPDYFHSVIPPPLESLSPLHPTSAWERMEKALPCPKLLGHLARTWPLLDARRGLGVLSLARLLSQQQLSSAVRYQESLTVSATCTKNDRLLYLLRNNLPFLPEQLGCLLQCLPFLRKALNDFLSVHIIVGKSLPLEGAEGSHKLSVKQDTLSGRTHTALGNTGRTYTTCATLNYWKERPGRLARWR